MHKSTVNISLQTLYNFVYKWILKIHAYKSSISKLVVILVMLHMFITLQTRGSEFSYTLSKLLSFIYLSRTIANKRLSHHYYITTVLAGNHRNYFICMSCWPQTCTTSTQALFPSTTDRCSSTDFRP